MAEKREKLMHFLNIGTVATPSYALIGDGVTSLTEEFNAESETKQYINQANGTTTVKSYTPSIQVEKEYIKGEALQTWLNGMVSTLPTGSDAEADYVRLNVFETTSTASVYRAVKRKCSIQIDSIGGDAGSELMNAFTIGGVGDGVQGTFNVSTLTFTPDA